ncbi:hypothetical protein DO021_18065 [Desulfobacter hydrogenophilus]|uniref:Uncharacterized protein n=1 Tax=Desulfobacter hydrogenophilus TaxID=2291 RepID=A0A328F7Q3_9BACT|nr:hypothetical protein [Desulfobacter hydrogenophilus]NDY73302.1 hypothetical protein [Desulfobacter hydrogenophilus]QBH15285.1 hypothetical protein EYB58_21645 [Desulfobacter hydrogenophilus]RAM00628.1 hypothetical protein DO021_18065 [Desulfobacter hydrogenophilus]
MTIDTIFYTQLATIFSFLIALFSLYRLLVKQKDATIELLKEKNDFLSKQIEIAQNNTPDKLAKRLSERINIFQDELSRLSEDKEYTQKTISEKEEKLEQLENQLSEIKEIASEYFCPHCKSPIEKREYFSEVHEYGDIDHEFIEFECGFSMADDRVTGECKYKK